PCSVATTWPSTTPHSPNGPTTRRSRWSAAKASSVLPVGDAPGLGQRSAAGVGEVERAAREIRATVAPAVQTVTQLLHGRLDALVLHHRELAPVELPEAGAGLFVLRRILRRSGQLGSRPGGVGVEVELPRQVQLARLEAAGLGVSPGRRQVV